jgi:hypothetical protein
MVFIDLRRIYPFLFISFQRPCPKTTAYEQWSLVWVKLYLMDSACLFYGQGEGTVVRHSPSSTYEI